MAVYLIHFERPVADDHPAQHYIGWCHEGGLRQRLETHRRGAGARILQVCNERGIGWRLVRTWPGASRQIERLLKRRKEAPVLCPVCAPGTRRGLSVGEWQRTRLYRPRLQFVSAPPSPATEGDAA